MVKSAVFQIILAEISSKRFAVLGSFDVCAIQAILAAVAAGY